jgi:Ca2+/H+ antiporter
MNCTSSCSYLSYLFFQLYTHADMFNESGDDDDEETPEEPLLSTFAAFSALALISVVVAVHSEYDSIYQCDLVPVRAANSSYLIILL